MKIKKEDGMVIYGWEKVYIILFDDNKMPVHTVAFAEDPTVGDIINMIDETIKMRKDRDTIVYSTMRIYDKDDPELKKILNFVNDVDDIVTVTVE